jgi:hypothetical protein
MVVWCGMLGSFAGAQELPAAATPLSASLQPSLAALEQVTQVLRIEKWKAPRDLRAATQNNLDSIERDLNATLPSLLSTADAAPGSLPAMLPVSQNLDALYDVSLRVTVVAESFAPADQAAAMEQALTGLEASRREFAERLRTAAVTWDQQLKDLQKAQAQWRAAAATPAPAPPCPAPAKKKVVRKKVAPKKPAPPQN